MFISSYCSRLSFSSYTSSQYTSDRNPGRRFARWMGTTLLGMPSQRVGSQDRLHTLRFVAYFNGSLIIQICSSLKDLRYLSIQKKTYKKFSKWDYSRMVKPMISDLPSFSTSSTCSSRIAFTLTARGAILTGRIHIPLNWFIPLSKWVKLWFPTAFEFLVS